MAGPEFFQTRMGQVFYEGTMPALVRELKKLNENLERNGDLFLYGNTKGKIHEAMAKIEAMPTFTVPGPTVWDSSKFKEKLTELIAKGENSGEAAGRMLGEHLDGMHDENPDVVIAELENVIEWAQAMLRELK